MTRVLASGWGLCFESVEVTGDFGVPASGLGAYAKRGDLCESGVQRGAELDPGEVAALLEMFAFEQDSATKLRQWQPCATRHSSICA